MSTTPVSTADAPARNRPTVVDYNSHTIDEYVSRWDTPMGPGEMSFSDTRKVSDDGVVSVSAVPFRTGADAVVDHAKYFAASHELFPMPESGSLEFSADIAAETPGTEPGRAVHGSYTGAQDGDRPYAASVLEGQQAAFMFNVTNVETSQLFDWFVSGSSAFALIERLPSIANNPTLPTADPTYVGLDKAYTQIITDVSLEPGTTHTYTIRYKRNATQSSVEFLLDGDVRARVDHVGIPLDTQDVQYTGVYPSYHNAPGEELGPTMSTFVVAHGLYNVLDAFPFQHPDAPELAVSIPMTERLFGQGVRAEFSNLTVTTIPD
jgi:hypothetical protein